MDKIKRMAGAFVVGGLMCVAMQVVMMVLAMVLPAEASMLVPALTLVTMGAIGCVLVLTGLQDKLARVGGYGANIVFSGLVDAVAGIYAGTTLEKGSSAEGTKAAVKFSVMVLGSVSLIGVVLGIVCALAGVPSALSNLEDSVADPGVLVFLYAFICCGIISIIGQAMMEWTKLPLPAIIIIEGAVGALLAMAGVFGDIETLCGAGMVCTVVDAGGGMFAGGVLAAIAGQPIRCIIILAVMVIVVAIGLGTGRVLVKRAQEAPRPSADELA